MATITSLDFDVKSNWDGSGIREAMDDIDRLKESLDSLTNTDVSINLDDEAAREAIDALKADIDSISDRTVHLSVEVDDGDLNVLEDRLATLDSSHYYAHAGVTSDYTDLDEIENRLREYDTSRYRALAEVDTDDIEFVALQRDLASFGRERETAVAQVNAQSAPLDALNTKMHAFGLERETGIAQVNAQSAPLDALNVKMRAFGAMRETGIAQVNAQSAPLDALDVKMRTFGAMRETATANVNVQSAALDAEMVKLRTFGAMHETATVDVNTDRAHAGLSDVTVWSDNARKGLLAASLQSGDTSGEFSKLGGDADLAARDLGDMAQWGNSASIAMGGMGNAAGGAANGLGSVGGAAAEAGGSMSGLIGPISIASAVLAGIIALAPIAAASVALLPVAFVAMGAVLISQNAQLQASFQKTFQDDVQKLIPLAKPLLDALSASLAQVGSWLDKISPLISAAFKAAAPLVQPLLNIVERLAQSALPGFTAAMSGMKPLLDGLGQGASSFGKYLGEAANVLARIPGLGAAMNQIMGAVGQVLLAVATSIAQVVSADHGKLLITTLQAISVLVRALTPILIALAPAFTLTANVIKLFGNAIIAIEAGVRAFWQLLQGGGPIVNALSTAWRAFTNALTSAWNTVAAGLGAAWRTFWNGLQTVATGIWNGMKSAWTSFVSGLTTAWQAVSGALASAWNTFWNGLKSVAQGIWNAMQSAWQAFVNFLTSAWNSISGALSSAWSAFWNGLKSVAQAVWDAMQSAWQAFVNFLTSAWNTISSALSSAWSSFWNGLKSVAQGIWDAMQSAWQAFVNFLISAWNTISSALSSAWNTFWNGLKSVAQGIWTAMQDAWNTFLSTIRSIWNSISSALESAWTAFWNTLKSVAQGIWDAMQSAWNSFLSTVRSIWNSVSSALESAWNSFWNTLKSVAQGIWDAMKSAWSGFLDGVRSIWDSVSSALASAWHSFWDGLINALKSAVSTMRTVWNDIEKVFGTPIEFVINTVLNKGILAAINWIISKLGGSSDLAVPDPHLPTFAQGGHVQGPGTGTSDSIVARVSAGEYIMPADRTADIGVHNMDAMRAGYTPAFAMGGLVGAMPAFAGGGAVGSAAQDEINQLEAQLKASNDPTQKALIQKDITAAQAQLAKNESAAAGSNGGGTGDISTTSGGASGSTKKVTGLDDGGLTTSDLEGAIKAVIEAIGGAGASLLGNAAQTAGGAISGAVSGAQDLAKQIPGVGGAISDVIGFLGGGSTAVGNGLDAIGVALLSWGQAEFDKGTDAIIHLVIDKLISKIPLPPGVTGQMGKGTAVQISTQFLHHIRDDISKYLLGQKQKAVESFGVAGVIPTAEHQAIIDAALAADGIPQSDWPEWEVGLNTLITRESAWNASAVNNYDSNAAAGTPSEGLAQVIAPTFAAYRNPSLSDNLLDPVANVAAAINYINAVYGGIGNVQQANANLPPKGYALGTNSATRGWHMIDENGGEWINFKGGENVLPHGQTPTPRNWSDDNSSRGGDVHVNVHHHWHGNERPKSDDMDAMADKVRKAVIAGTGRR